jgi:cold shock CspA family protein
LKNSVPASRAVVSSSTGRRRGTSAEIFSTSSSASRWPNARTSSSTSAKGDAGEREHALVAIREAFAAAARQIEDVARDMRGQVKAHLAESHGRIASIFAGDGCGFIETADGREIYFHRNAVLNGGFARLSVGSEVRFVEENGEKGAQASTVRLVGKHHLA